MPYKKILGANVHYRNESSRMSKGTWIFWYVIFGGLTIASLWLGVSSYFKEQAFLSRAELDTGTITTYEWHFYGGTGEYCPRIEFTSKAGEPVAVQGTDCPKRPDDSKIGQTVQVYYDPEHPEKYQEKSSLSGHLGLTAGLIAAAFFSLFWIIPLLVAVFRKRTSAVRPS